MSNIFSKRTQMLIELDLLKYEARLKVNKQKINPKTDKLHLGCQGKKINGWLNVDIIASDLNIDLASGYLPFKDESFKFIVCQQTIEHLEIVDELIPLLKEIRRVCMPHAEIWLSCPDIFKICSGYLKDKGKELLEGKKRRYKYSQGKLPVQHVINAHFYQNGEHQNLFDFELLKWVLSQAKLRKVEQVTERIFLDKFPEFPIADDEDHSLYVKIVI